ncbi:MAG: S8 family serine peptidase [Ilumatobacteraceae bacterium]
MSLARRAVTLAVIAALVMPALQNVTASASVEQPTTQPARSYIVTTRGEFASVVRADLDVRATTVEIDSHRFAGELSADELALLRGDPRVGSVDLNGIVSNAATQTDGPDGFIYPNDRIPWGLDRLDSRNLSFDGSYTYDTDGSGVTVYVVDSGVNATHVEFAGGRVQSGWDYRQNNTALNSYIAIPGASPCGTSAESAAAADQGMTDQQGHGTHVSATVVGATVGVAKGATVIPVRALDCTGSGTYVMVDEALKWIASHHTSGPAVVNLSLGVSPSDDDPNPTSTAIKNAINALIAEGIPVVVAAGNEQANSCLTMPVRYEADYAGVIGVAASGWDDEEASFSNWGDCVDVFAPGIDILSAYKTSSTSYIELSGTSMATPHVSGVVARLLEADTSRTPADIDSLITSTATRCAIAPYDDYASSTPNRLVSSATQSVTPTRPCAPVISGGSVGNRSVLVAWTAPTDNGGSTLTGYAVSTSPSSAGCTTTGATSCTVPNLAAGQTYSFSVAAINAEGTSRPSVSYTGMPTGSPDAPVLSAATAGLTSIVASWSAALGDSNTYTVTASPNGGSCASTGTSCTISGLSQGTTYSLTAVTTNSAGTSAASAALSATTAAVPAMPTVSSSVAGLNSVTLNWSAATGASSYRVKNSSGTTVCETADTSCVVTGLVGGVAQMFTVEGVNSYGSTSSEQVSVVPDSQVNAISGVKVKAANKSLVVSWSADSANDVVYTAMALGTSAKCTATTTSCTLTKLVNGRAYKVVVVGANASSNSPSAVSVAAYAGFTVKATKVKRKRKTRLTSFVVPVSKGKRTWREVGACRISGKYLITPSKKTTCKLILKTAKTKTVPATSITLRISIT